MPGKPSPLVFTMARGHDGPVWLAGQGLFRWVEGQVEQVEMDPEKARQVAVGEDGALWLADTSGGLNRFAPGNLAAPSLALTPSQGLCPGRLAFLRAGHQGRLWGGGRGGLLLVEGNKASCFTTAHGLPANDVTHVLEDDDGTPWIAMIGTSGLARRRQGRFDDIGNRVGLPRGGFYGIADDGQGRLWLTSAQGARELSAWSSASSPAKPGPEGLVGDITLPEQPDAANSHEATPKQDARRALNAFIFTLPMLFLPELPRRSHLLARIARRTVCGRSRVPLVKFC